MAQYLGQALPRAHGDHAEAQRRQDGGGLDPSRFFGMTRSDRLSHQRVGGAQKTDRKTQQNEGHDAAQAHARQLGPTEVTHEDGIDQRHHAVRQRGNGDRPRESGELTKGSVSPGDGHDEP